MSSRFATNLCLLLLGAWLSSATFALGRHVVAWIALGVGAVAVLIALAGFAMAARGGVQRVLDVLAAIGGGWLVVASRTMPAGVIRWTSVGEAGLLAALATLGLVLNEHRHSRVATAAIEMPRLDAEPSLRPAVFNPHPALAGRSGDRI